MECADTSRLRLFFSLFFRVSSLPFFSLFIPTDLSLCAVSSVLLRRFFHRPRPFFSRLKLKLAGQALENRKLHSVPRSFRIESKYFEKNRRASGAVKRHRNVLPCFHQFFTLSLPVFLSFLFPFPAMAPSLTR